MSTTWATSPERPEGLVPRDPSAPPAAQRRDGADAWKPWTAPAALVGAIMAATVGGLIVAVASIPFGAELSEDSTPPGVLLAGTFLQDACFIAAALLFARMTGPAPARLFGFVRPRFWRSVGLIVATYVAFVTFAGVWSVIVEIEEDTDLLRDLGADRSDVLLVLAGILVCVGAPVVEEFLFRGYIYRALRNWRGVWPAALISGVVFGAIHLASSPIGAIVPLMVFGVGLALLYQWTGSLYPCIALHAINNAIAFSILNDWSWQVPLVIAGALAACAAVVAPFARRAPRTTPAAAPAL